MHKNNRIYIVGIVYIFFIYTPHSYAQELTYDSVCTPTNDCIYYVVEQMPEYPGGTEELMRYISKNLKFPGIYSDEDKMLLMRQYVYDFVVEKDGSLSNIRQVRPKDSIFRDYFLYLFEDMPKWTPGIHNNDTVRTKYVIPIHIHLR